ncbi:hypothetical protein ACHAWF_011082 [Thalassiosira exigua]
MTIASSPTASSPAPMAVESFPDAPAPAAAPSSVSAEASTALEPEPEASSPSPSVPSASEPSEEPSPAPEKASPGPTVKISITASHDGGNVRLISATEPELSAGGRTAKCTVTVHVKPGERRRIAHARVALRLSLWFGPIHCGVSHFLPPLRDVAKRRRRAHRAREDRAHAILLLPRVRQRARRRRRRGRRRRQAALGPVRRGQRPRGLVPRGVAGNHRLLHRREPRAVRRRRVAPRLDDQVRRRAADVDARPRDERIDLFFLLAALHVQPPPEARRGLRGANLSEGRRLERVPSRRGVAGSDPGGEGGGVRLRGQRRDDRVDPAPAAPRRDDGRVLRRRAAAPAAGRGRRRGPGRSRQGGAGQVSPVHRAVHVSRRVSPKVATNWNRRRRGGRIALGTDAYLCVCVL